jgi:hypothetical protein
MAINVNLKQTSAQLVSAALMQGKGSPEFVAECKEDFFARMKMIEKVRDPNVSKHNLEALRNGKLNFIVTGDNNE